jgi:hypothetical protein
MKYEITNKTDEIDLYFKKYYEKIWNMQGYHHSVLDFLYTDREHICFVDRIDGKIINCQTVVEMKPLHFHYSFGMIHPDYRNQGRFNEIRHDMLEYLINERNGIYFKAVYLGSNADRYLKIGFKKNINKSVNIYYAYSSWINLSKWWA